MNIIHVSTAMYVNLDTTTRDVEFNELGINKLGKK